MRDFSWRIQDHISDELEESEQSSLSKSDKADLRVGVSDAVRELYRKSGSATKAEPAAWAMVVAFVSIVGSTSVLLQMIPPAATESPSKSSDQLIKSTPEKSSELSNEEPQAVEDDETSTQTLETNEPATNGTSSIIENEEQKSELQRGHASDKKES